MAKKDYTVTEINYKKAYEDLYAAVARMLLKRLAEVEGADGTGDFNYKGCSHVMWLLNEWDDLRSNYP